MNKQIHVFFSKTTFPRGTKTDDIEQERFLINIFFFFFLNVGHDLVLTDLEEEARYLAAELAASILTTRRVEKMVGWEASVGDTFASTQHPDDHIGHAILGLKI